MYHAVAVVLCQPSPRNVKEVCGSRFWNSVVEQLCGVSAQIVQGTDRFIMSKVVIKKLIFLMKNVAKIS